MLNECTFIGNLGKDPEVRSLSSGSEVVSFSLGVSESWLDKTTGERKSKTEWVNIVIFNANLVKLAKDYLKKGSKIFIRGQLRTRKWTDKEGHDRYSTEVVLQNFNGTIVMLDGKKTEAAAPQSNAAADAIREQFPGATGPSEEYEF